MDRKDFLPTQKEDIGDSQLDFILVTGDAYVDHPSFGTALIGRYIQDMGFSVGVIAQPDYTSTEDFARLGRPKYCFMVASGNMDSMVNNYTSAKKRRSEDLYSPNGEAGKRPDRAVIVYCNRINEAFPHAQIIIAGIEASLRRFAHYDYWSNKVRNSILIDSGADMLIYGMAENATREVVLRLAAGEKLSEITGVAGTCYTLPYVPDYCVEIPSAREVKNDKRAFAEAFATQYLEQDPIRGRSIAQFHDKKYVIAEKPAMPLTQKEFDRIYELFFTRTWHPDYDKYGGIPALAEVKFSVTHNRGCFGECAFCSLAFHQGRIIQTRSTDSVIKEVKYLSKLPDFKGYIHDIGGPTANFSHTACDKQRKYGTCRGKRCLSPTPCEHLNTDHRPFLRTLREARKVPGVKKVFIRSGIRFDYALYDKDHEFIKELCKYHVSGRLKVAPEHISDHVLNIMGKPSCAVFEKFESEFHKASHEAGLNQFLVSYYISSHPGSRLTDAVALAEYMRDHDIHPEQVQDFYPTPGTLATCMYYTGLDPLTMKPVYTAKSAEEKQMQRALLQYRYPQNHDLVRKALVKCHRKDLIGFGKKCLVPPEEFDRKIKERKEKEKTKTKISGKNTHKKGNSKNQTKQKSKRR